MDRSQKLMLSIIHNDFFLRQMPRLQIKHANTVASIYGNYCARPGMGKIERD